jgi:adenosylcobinamide-GDP ribazoletransferase
MPLVEEWVGDLVYCLRFYSRLEPPFALGAASRGFPAAFRAVPLAGALIGACGGFVYAVARGSGLNPSLAATLAVGVLVFIAGGLHEDGLADFVDGLGGGRTRERTLEIMRDSRIGAYGALALILATVARILALVAISEKGTFAVVIAIVATAAVSRTVGLCPMLRTAPARADGLGASMPRPDREVTIPMGLLTLAVSTLPALSGQPLLQVFAAAAASLVGALAVGRIAERRIGGYTGDVLGAAQQVAEVMGLLALSAR